MEPINPARSQDKCMSSLIDFALAAAMIPGGASCRYFACNFVWILWVALMKAAQ
jgi:hypothetical protein